MNLVFECENCGSSLKVRKAAAAREILCPKCGKKTSTPITREFGERPEETSPAGCEPDDQASPPTGTGKKDSSKKAPKKDLSTEGPTAPDEDKSSAELKKAQARILELNQKLADEQKLRSRVEELESALATARKAAEASGDSVKKGQAAAETLSGELRRKADAEKQELSERHRSEISALQREIAYLQKNSPTSAPAARVPTGPSKRAPEAPPPEPEDETDPDTLIEPLLQHHFGRNLRNALLIHAGILLIASLGFIRGCMLGSDEEGEAGAGEAASVETSAVPETVEESDAPEPDPLTTDPGDRSGPDAGEALPAEPEEESAEEPRPPTELEERLESLPEPGEAPEPTPLDFDL